MIGEGHLIKAVHNQIVDSGDRLVEFGTAQFSGTGASVQVSTNLTEIEALILTPNAASYNANDQLSSDRSISNGKFTVVRASTGGTSGLIFSYIAVGKRSSSA